MEFSKMSKSPTPKKSQKLIQYKYFIINIKRVLYCIVFNIFMIILLLFFYDFEIKHYSTLALFTAFSLLFSPIFFLKDTLNPIFVFITVQLLPLINFLEKDLTRSPYKYGSDITGDYYNFTLFYSILLIIIWFTYCY